MTMPKPAPLSTFLAIVAERRRALGIPDEARNRGRRRTPEKRELLRRIHRRAVGSQATEGEVLIGATRVRSGPVFAC
jgi:hypothetical protein